MRLQGGFAVATNEVDDVLFEGLDQTLTWNGKPIWKNPVDLIVYHEIAHELTPSVVVETGTSLGGSAEFWRDQPGVELVVTIDVDQRCEWTRRRIVAIEGSSTDPDVVAQVKHLVAGVRPETVIVNLDSNHSRGHVLAELDAYAELVTPGSYLIVEDGIDDLRRGLPGALAATRDWLVDHPEFEVDRHRTRAGITNCPDGYLRRR